MVLALLFCVEEKTIFFLKQKRNCGDVFNILTVILFFFRKLKIVLTLTSLKYM